MTTGSTEAAGEPSLLTQRIGKHILVIVLNRPEKRNAINVALSHSLADAVRRAEEDESIRAVVLTGAGTKCFCAGADLDDIAAGRGNDIAVGHAGMGGLVYARRSKPWIAAIRGSALGGGLEIALACDMIVAGQNALLGLPEVRHGLIAAAGGAYRLAQRLPQPLANEMLVTGMPINAERAWAQGLVNHVVPDDDVIARALQLAELIAANPPQAVRESLAVASSANKLDEEALRVMLANAAARLSSGAVSEEGLRAFPKNKPPSSLH